jgi:hypothetical protein
VLIEKRAGPGLLPFRRRVNQIVREPQDEAAQRLALCAPLTIRGKAFRSPRSRRRVFEGLLPHLNLLLGYRLGKQSLWLPRISGRESILSLVAFDSSFLTAYPCFQPVVMAHRKALCTWSGDAPGLPTTLCDLGHRREDRASVCLLDCFVGCMIGPRFNLSNTPSNVAILGADVTVQRGLASPSGGG